jgi:hypothetical protein
MPAAFALRHARSRLTRDDEEVRARGLARFLPRSPDPTESKPCSRLLICLQINQQTIAAKVLDRKAALTGGLLLRRASASSSCRPGVQPDWAALMVDVDPDELKKCICDFPALFYVHPDDCRPRLRAAHQCWVRIIGQAWEQDGRLSCHRKLIEDFAGFQSGGFNRYQIEPVCRKAATQSDIVRPASASF